MANPIKTRISLRYDSLTNWTTHNPELLKGEIAICQIDTADSGKNTADATAGAHSTPVPTVLFKVGGSVYPAGHEKEGKLKTFNDLPWASAKAADVYSWAKQSDSDFITWLNSRTDVEFLDEAAVAALIKTETDKLSAADSALESRIETLEANFGGDASTEGTIDNKITAAADAAKEAAKSYTDEREIEIEKYADEQAEAAKTGAENTAKQYTDAQIATVTTAINTEKTDREAADDLIKAQLGTGFSATTTVATEIARVEGIASEASTQANTNKTD